MKQNHSFFSLSSLCALAAAIMASAPVASGALSDAAKNSWTADNGNGTYSNPLFYEEFEDPDPIRVGDDYYLAGTTMHMMPAVQIMHSKDLVNWDFVGYCTNKLDLGPEYRLEGGNIYGKGIWAPCIRYHKGVFYIFCNVNGAGLEVFRSKSINGPWERNQLPGKHDMSVLFDDDLDKVFIISGAGSPYPIDEINPDLMSFNTNAPKRALVGRMGEGHHLYKINGKYIDISCQPGGAVNQMVAKADSIDGPWTVETMVQGESLGITSSTPSKAQPGDRGIWIHQGGMVNTPSGQWWCTIMSDHGSAGRMISLVPITWTNGFPIIGLPGNLRKAPNTWVKPDTGFSQKAKPAFVHDDNFNSGKLNINWQWNHVEDDSKWSLTEKKGVLRLHSLPAPNFYAARNSLCQKPPAPESIMTVELTTSGMTAGDTAGLGLLCSPYSWIGVAKSSNGATLQMLQASGGGGRRGASAPAPVPVIASSNPPAHLWLRVACNFDTDVAAFSWSADGKTYTPAGNWNIPGFQLQTFQGVRPALFHFNTNGAAGGYADFDNYTVVQPRARGIEREIPVGKKIVLTSGADGTVLSTDDAGATLVNIAADKAAAANTQFKVIDLGKGRVALRTAGKKYVSVGEKSVVLKELNGKPTDAETFQWVNLMRGDTMLMTLTNHQYLTTKPNTPGPVLANATGATPARKGGECFKWKAVD